MEIERESNRNARRDKKRDKRRNGMRIDSRSVFMVERMVGKRGAVARAKKVRATA